MTDQNSRFRHDDDDDDDDQVNEADERLRQINAIRDSLFYLQCEARNLELRFLAHLVGVAAECARELSAERDRIVH